MSTQTPSPNAAFHTRIEHFLPGVTLVLIVTAAAYGLRQVPGFSALSPMFSAILIGMAFANFTTVPSPALPGIALLSKRLLRVAVALLGLQLTLTQVMDVGTTGVVLIVLVVAATYGFTVAAARLLGVNPRLGRLLAAGTSICGASAIAATNAIEQATDEEVSYAIACVTLFGTLAIVCYPVVASLLDLTATSFGFWTGLSVHEVAQVVATAYQYGDEAGAFAVIVKLTRVLLLAPLLVVVASMAVRRRSAADTPINGSQMLPLFVAAFILLMLANTAGIVPQGARDSLVSITPVILTCALGALGLGTRFGAIREQGLRPLLLAALSSLFISLVAVLAVAIWVVAPTYP